MSQDGQYTSNKRQKTTNNNMGANQNYYDILDVDKQATAEGKIFFCNEHIICTFTLYLTNITVH